jgi:hypothetical protein
MNWSTVFNTSLGWWGSLNNAHAGAVAANYPYFAWNGRIYDTKTGQDTGQLVENLEL